MALDSELLDINWSEPFESTDVQIKTEEQIPEDCLKLLQDSFGHLHFRKMQWKIISSILYDKRDNCVIMATGYGKSLCFQFPSVYRNTITLVVSPLISLMQDQVNALRFYNLKACFLGSAQLNRDTVYEVIDRQYNIVYVTPEYLTSESGEFLIGRIKDDLTLIAIDEAHCISKWGHDFRAAYRGLCCLRNWCPDVPILAMTATATHKVQQDIINNLNLRDPQIISTGFDRPNLEFIVKPKTDTWDDIGEHIRNVKIGAIIVYCISRRITEETAAIISSHGYRCGVYHSGLPLKNRNKTHDDFIHDRIRVVVATIAFGMGINKPDVRLVIHYGVAKDLEGYYQEVGRAGRDGLPSKCLLFHHRQDWSLQRRIYYTSNPHTSSEQMEKLMKAMKGYVETMDCRRKYILNYFGSDCKLERRSDCCDNCKTSLTAPIKPINLYSKYQGLDVDGLLDITEESKLLIKLLQDMNSRFGLRKAILILRGSKSKEVPSGYIMNSTFGKLKHRPDKWIQAVADSLVELGFLAFEEVREAKFIFTRCLLTNKGRVWISGMVEQQPIKVVPNSEFIKLLNPRIVSAPKIVFPLVEKKDDNQPSSSSNIPLVNKTATSSAILANNSTLSAPATKPDIYRPLLKARTKLASLFGAMPYLVASSRALDQMAKNQPTTMEEFRNLRLDGYSEEKIVRFGPVFLKVIKEYKLRGNKTSVGVEQEDDQQLISFEPTDPTAVVVKQEKVSEASISSNLSQQSEQNNRSQSASQDSIEVIEPEPPQVIEIGSDIENVIFDEWNDSDDSELTPIANEVENLHGFTQSQPISSENRELDLLLDALQQSEAVRQEEPQNPKQSRVIKKKPINNLEYEDDSDSDLFEADWDHEIDESDLTSISQQAEESLNCDVGTLTVNTSNASSIDSTTIIDQKPVVIPTASNEIIPNNCIKQERQERKPRIIQRKVSNVFEYEDDSDSDTDLMPIVSPKKRTLPSWMTVSLKRKR